MPIVNVVVTLRADHSGSAVLYSGVYHFTVLVLNLLLPHWYLSSSTAHLIWTPPVFLRPPALSSRKNTYIKQLILENPK